MGLSGSITFPGKGKTSDTPGIPDERLQQLLEDKDTEAAREHGRPESWQIIDGALVIFDYDAPPAWLKPVLDARDEDGNTLLAEVVANQRELLAVAERGVEIRDAVVAYLDGALGGQRS